MALNEKIEIYICKNETHFHLTHTFKNYWCKKKKVVIEENSSSKSFIISQNLTHDT